MKAGRMIAIGAGAYLGLGLASYLTMRTVANKGNQPSPLLILTWPRDMLPVAAFAGAGLFQRVNEWLHPPKPAALPQR